MCIYAISVFCFLFYYLTLPVNIDHEENEQYECEPSTSRHHQPVTRIVHLAGSYISCRCSQTIVLHAMLYKMIMMMVVMLSVQQ